MCLSDFHKKLRNDLQPAVEGCAAASTRQHAPHVWGRNSSQLTACAAQRPPLPLPRPPHFSRRPAYPAMKGRLFFFLLSERQQRSRFSGGLMARSLFFRPPPKRLTGGGVTVDMLISTGGGGRPNGVCKQPFFWPADPQNPRQPPYLHAPGCTEGARG